MSGRFLVYEDRASKWRFRLKDSNGQVVAIGQAYSTRDEVTVACHQVKDAAKGAEVLVVCPCCQGDPNTVCDACGKHDCWAGRFMCEDAYAAGTRQR